ncbi:MAG: beta strand repeat-containing protein, partial [Pirellula sp.]
GYKSGGTEALPNGAWAAMVIRDGAKFNRVGTDGDGVSDILERNLVTVTAYANGIAIHNASDNIVSGNYAGVDVSGTIKVGNLNTGVAIDGGSARNIVGVKDDSSPGESLEGNLLTACLVGVYIGSGSSSNQVSGNLIGTDATGTQRLNVAVGVIIQAANNVIGTDGDGQSDALERNIISGGTEWGIRMDSTNATGNRIAGNYIGTDITGTVPIENEYAGIGITDGASSNLIGTNGDGASDQLERNVISGNKGHGIILSQSGTNNNVIAGNYLGINALGNAALPNKAWTAIVIQSGVLGTRIGTDGNGQGDLAERNVISGSAGHGIYIAGNQSRVAGNWIGLDATGAFAILNNGNGIIVGEGAQDNILGTDGNGSAGEAYERNVISGNKEWGIVLGGQGTSLNRVSGNYIGTSTDGLSAIPNTNGIAIVDRASSNIIGVNGDGLGDDHEGNLISGNNGHAVYVASVGTTGNTITGNLIGTDATGNAKLGNLGWASIFIETGPTQTLIGTNGDGVSDTFERNVISGSSGFGIASRANYTTIAGNYIGTNKEGTAAIPNPSDGVFLFDGAKYSIVGVNSDGSPGESNEGNLISGNTNHGLQILGAETKYNRVSGNRVGTNANGTGAIPNNYGLKVAEGASYNSIGTNSDGTSDTFERNLVSGNVYHGIYLAGSANRNQISGNWVGVDATGQNPLPNTWGIRMEQTQFNLVGTNGDGLYDTVERNIVSGNLQHGFSIIDSSSSNQVSGNYVGTDPTGTLAIPNQTFGFEFYGAASNNIIGTNGDGQGDAVEGNLISGNNNHAIYITHSGTNNNIIAGNWIGINSSGNSKLKNGGFANIFIDKGPQGTRIGTNGDSISDTLERNVISGNDVHGITVFADDTTISGNFIGTNASGTAAISNGSVGVAIQNDAKNNVVGVNGD